MNCTFDKEKLTGYYDGELDAAEKAEVERHIASCSECLRELGELKSAAVLVKELPRLRAPRSIAEGVAREIQTAGKVHRFAKVRRNVLWACAAAAGVLVALNVAYFGQASRSPESAAAGKPAPTVTMARTPAPESAPAAETQDPGARRALDRAGAEAERGRQMEARKNVLEEKAQQKGAEPARKQELEAPRPEPLVREKAAAAPTAKSPEAKPAPPPAAAPPAAPKPAAAPTPAPAKDQARPTDVPAEKPAVAKKERDGEGLAKADADQKLKRPAELPGEAAPTHLTLASTQLAKARPAMELALRQMGVAIPGAPPAMTKGMASKGVREESTFNLELTDAQISRLRQELEKLGHSRLVVASPGDQVLAQFGDTGLYRSEKKGVASGGAPSPAPRGKTADAPTAKAETSKAAESKELEKEKEAEEALARKFGDDKSAGPKRKVVLHLLEVPFMPDPQPAGDPVKK